MRSAFASLVLSTLWLAGCALLSGCATGSDDPDAGDRPDVPVISGDAGPGCMRDRDCDDRVACTIDLCSDTRCENRPCADCCDEGLQCVPGFGCRAAPTPCTTDEECIDTVRCTLDYCRDATSCVHDPEPGLCEEGEICLPAVGCIPEPPTVCSSPADCEIGVICVGEWSCDPEFGCQFVSARDCDDGVACTIDACEEDEGGCTHTLPDIDGDGYAAETCGGDDCNDADADVHPNAAEVCGDGDLNCDGMFVAGCCTADQPCTSSCGTPGRTVCDGTEVSCAPPAETCNGMDDDCDGNADDGFECVESAAESCTASCGSGGSRTCGSACTWSACTPPAETCNGMDDDCDGTTDDGFACAVGSSGTCMTTCNSTGTRACLPDCTYDSCVAPAETCNGVDDDCDSAVDDGFTCVRGEMESCNTTCGSTGSRICGNSCTWPSGCTAPAETCDGSDNDCDGTADEGFACRAGSSSSCATGCGSTGTRMCLGNCTYDTCVPPAETCNGVDDNCNMTPDEGFGCPQSATAACTSIGGGWFSGTATCPSDCSGWNTSGCTRCGDGNIDAPEQCDMSDLGGNNCTTIGMNFGSGTLACASNCMWNTAACSRCGNGMIDAGEQCDGTNLNGQMCTTIPGGFIGGTLRCNSMCRYDTAMCTLWNFNGSYTTNPDPAYTCTGPFGITVVNFNITSFGFTEAGSELRVTGAPCGTAPYMVGASPRSSPTRSFDVSCLYGGSCNETYRLVGMFTSDTTWTGTFTASYSPNGGSCYTCSNQSWNVSGTR